MRQRVKILSFKRLIRNPLIMNDKENHSIQFSIIPTYLETRIIIKFPSRQYLWKKILL